MKVVVLARFSKYGTRSSIYVYAFVKENKGK